MSKEKATTDSADDPLMWDDDDDEPTAEKPARAPRLTPEQCIPVAEVTTSNGAAHGEFAVLLRTGRRTERLSPLHAEVRATKLQTSADQIRKIARKVEKVNADE